MNLIGKYFRPIGSKIQKLVDYKGSTIKPQAQAWQHRYILHIELLQNKQKFSKYMNDQSLQEFINQHYFLGDIVRIANMIAADSSMYNRELTDSQVSFLAFTHNLYHHETIKIPELIQMISSHLLQKIADKNYAFASRQLQKNYLEQIYFLTCRDNLPPQLHREIVTNLVRFVERKWLIDKQSISEINDKTLDYLWETLPYIPFEKGTNILSHYQTVLLRTIQYEALQLRVKRDRGIIQKNILNEGIERFSELAEICIRVANSRNKYVDIFSALPTEFSSQQFFADWLVVLREFMIEPLLKRLDYKKMDTYHGKLAYQNRKYNKKRGYLSIQAYCQSLLFLNVYNPRTFAYFFEADDKTFVSNSSKGSMQEQRNNP